MQFNTFTKTGPKEITLLTKSPLGPSIVKQFPKYNLGQKDGYYVYTFEAYPNMSFVLRALINKYQKHLKVTPEAALMIKEASELAVVPRLSLYKTEQHVQIDCPPLPYYMEIVQTISAGEKGFGVYTIPIARAHDAVRAVEAYPSFLPGFVTDKSLDKALSKPIEGFDGSVASLYSAPIEELFAVSNAYRVKPENFEAMGYGSLADFLLTRPNRYIDRTQITSLEDLAPKDSVTFIGEITDKQIVYYKHGQFKIKVGATEFKVMFYNRTWMVDKFNVGEEVMVMGEYRGKLEIAGQSLENMIEAKSLDIVPIYPQSQKNNITTRNILNCTYELLERLRPFKDEMATYIKNPPVKMSISKAVNELHFPSSSYTYLEALETLAFYELVYLQLMIRERKETEVKAQGVSKPYVKGGFFDKALASLPFELTQAQKQGVNKMSKYMTSSMAEQVLLTADVGSGKTVIAQLACMQAIDNGYQAVLAGPTEVLAKQLYDTFNKLINSMPEDSRPTIVYMGGKMRAAEKRSILAAIKNGSIQLIVGTHSVLNKNIQYNDLGLVVIDEQQKFGTAQREALLESRSDGRKPDLLAQTATPIPRSTAQAFYGDIDMIELNGRPPGRIEVQTKWVKENPQEVTKNANHEIWKDIKSEVDKGHQVFVVVPMVYESKKMDSASVEGAYKDLKKTLKGIPVGFTHGSLKKEEQHAAMDAFRNNETKVLIASTVIEVGVDVPNATRIIVLSANRMGASSLHQIRGRVGRSNLPSTCYLVAEPSTKSGNSRLQALVDSSDGFDIAKVDLKTRGEGDLFGLKQAGDSALRFATLVDHSKLITEAQSLAREIYDGPQRDEALRDAKAIIKGDV